jgi:hypothetical protein
MVRGRQARRATGVVIGLWLACTACGSQAAAPATSPSSQTKPTTPLTTTTAAPTTTRTTPPPTAPPDAQVTVSPKTVEIGQSIVVSGTGCTFPPSVTGKAAVMIGQCDAYSSQGSEGGTVPDSTGAWSITLPIDRSTPLGSQTVAASCGQLSGGAGTNIWEYPEAPSVDITSTYSLAVRPGTTVTPGTTLYVSSEGSCSVPTQPSVPTSYQGGYGELVFSRSAISDFYSRGGTTIPEVPTDALGNWSTSFVVPPATAPGDYYLSGVCVATPYTNTNWYNPVSITVVAP